MSAKAILAVLCFPTLLAISSGQSSASCMKPPVAADVISRFMANPQVLVAPNSDTRTIEATTRDLAGTDAALAAELIRIARGTTPRFQMAIAAGLAQAALACSAVDQGAAQLIQEAVASFEDGQFQTVFAAVAGDLSTAATEAAGASATASVGSVVVVNANQGAPTNTTRSGGGGAVSALVLTTSGLNSTTNGVTVSVTAANPVSPTR